MAAKARVQKRLYYKIGEACKALGIQPYVLRYWETEFPALSPSKSRSGQRVYSEKELEIIRRIKQLLYDEGYTIAGAKKKLEGELATGTLGDSIPAGAAPPAGPTAQVSLPPPPIASPAPGRPVQPPAPLLPAAAPAAAAVGGAAPEATNGPVPAADAGSLSEAGQDNGSAPGGLAAAAGAPKVAIAAPDPGAARLLPLNPQDAAAPRPARAAGTLAPFAEALPTLPLAPAAGAMSPAADSGASTSQSAPRPVGSPFARRDARPGASAVSEEAPPPSAPTPSAPSHALDTEAAKRIETLRKGIDRALQQAREILTLLDSRSPQ